MHCHQSLWKDGAPLFYDEVGYAGLSDLGRYYVGGLLKHAPPLLAFTNPTVNSYHRLVPGFQAPVNLVYSHRNRSACLRLPITRPSPNTKHLDLRPPPTRPGCTSALGRCASPALRCSRRRSSLCRHGSRRASQTVSRAVRVPSSR